MGRVSQAKRVAQRVVQQIKDNRLVNITEAMVGVGYSEKTAKSQQKRVTEHKDYKGVMMKFEEEIALLKNDAIDIMKKKKSKATYRDGLESVHTLTKIERLLNDKSTENVAHSISGVLDSLEDTRKEA